MMTGNSIHHVNQGVGTCYSKTEVAGYYNDLTEKVTKDDPDILVPQYPVDTGATIYFSIGIFQYGLAAYDLLLKTGEARYQRKFLACANWAVENQQENGSWVTFAYKNPVHPYSSMAQGEGISLLVRAHKETKDETYLKVAKKALEFMLTPISEGGTAEYCGEDLCLYEATYCPPVLNGWIFSLWGLFDYCKYNRDAQAELALSRTLATLKKRLPDYDIKYWSRYDDKRNISSPFYHKLHIAQLTVMYDLFQDPVYKKFADRWTAYEQSFWKPKWAFVNKAIQKITE